MNFRQLILRNLLFFRKQNLATLTGVAISTAILTGALVVGDSVRYSLQNITLSRLGKISYTVSAGDRFFSQALADSLSGKLGSPVAPVIQLEGVASNPDSNTRINKVQIIGIDRSFKAMWEQSPDIPEAGEAVINASSAERLGLKEGGTLILRMRKLSNLPQAVPFAAEKVAIIPLRLKVRSVANDDHAGRFSLRNNQMAPFNVFVSLKELSGLLRLPESCNRLLIAGIPTDTLPAGMIAQTIQRNWSLYDAGISLSQTSSPGIMELRTGSIFIQPSLSKAVSRAFPDSRPFLSYLVNSFSINGHSTPYSFVTAADSSFIGTALRDKEIILNEWLANDLQAGPGDTVMLRYYVMKTLQALQEDSCRFVVKAVAGMNQKLFDKSLVPDFPGMTDAANCRDWESGAPVDMAKIREKDEDYWRRYQATPKAIISLDQGSKLWQNPFGTYTSIRLPLDSLASVQFSRTLLAELDPAGAGFRTDPVMEEGFMAASNPTDFSGLFLGLSFFIIVSSLLLTTLLVGLNIHVRTSWITTMHVLGFKRRQIFRLLFYETLLLAVAGSIAGSLLGIAYNRVLVTGLKSVWQGAVNTSSLQAHVVPSTLLLGIVAGCLVSVITLSTVLFSTLQKSPASLIKGAYVSRIRRPRSGRIAGRISLAAVILSATAIAFGSFFPSEASASLPMISGGLLLFFFPAFLIYQMHKPNRPHVRMTLSFRHLAWKNLSARSRRTAGAVTLLALGVFSIILTGIHRKTAEAEKSLRSGGTGGFMLWAETTVPFKGSLNTTEGRKKYGLYDEPALQDVRLIELSRVEHDDASCLNLNQVTNPTLTGVPAELFDSLKAFSFSRLMPSIDSKRPWMALTKEISDSIIPAYADQTVIEWSLRKKIGDTLVYKGESGNTIRILLAGGLKNSIFQGSLLISDSLLVHHFPSSALSNLLLIDGPPEQEKQVTAGLESLFRDYGIEVASAAERLQSFNEVENTYLDVFTLLGGLGVILGVAGLGILLLRNVRDRKGEIATCLAIGFRPRQVLRILISEYTFILVYGTLAGVIAAIVAVYPAISANFGEIPWLYLATILVLILIAGLLWTYIPARTVLRGNLIRVLRNE